MLNGTLCYCYLPPNSRIQEFNAAIFTSFGYGCAYLIYRKISNLCRRQKRTKVPNPSTLSDEIPLCKREINETQNETLVNDELKPIPLYTEIAVYNECEHVHVCI